MDQLDSIQLAELLLSLISSDGFAKGRLAAEEVDGLKVLNAHVFDSQIEVGHENIEVLWAEPRRRYATLHSVATQDLAYGYEERLLILPPLRLRRDSEPGAHARFQVGKDRS